MPATAFFWPRPSSTPCASRPRAKPASAARFHQRYRLSGGQWQKFIRPNPRCDYMRDALKLLVPLDDPTNRQLDSPPPNMGFVPTPSAIAPAARQHDPPNFPARFPPPPPLSPVRHAYPQIIAQKTKLEAAVIESGTTSPARQRRSLTAEKFRAPGLALAGLPLIRYGWPEAIFAAGPQTAAGGPCSVASSGMVDMPP